MLPGVQSADLVSAMPLTGESWLDGVIRTDGPNSDSKISNYRWISPAYLSTMRIPLLRGRLLTDADRPLKSALISERTANAGWPDQDPIDQLQRLEASQKSQKCTREYPRRVHKQHLIKRWCSAQTCTR
jgi:hypothetical protein